MKCFVGVFFGLVFLLEFFRFDYIKVFWGSYVYYLVNWCEVGILNFVMVIFVDWRGYDSLGEVMFLFVVIIGFYLFFGGKWK